MKSHVQRPFPLDIGGIVRRARQLSVKVDGVSIELPFVSVSVEVADVEQAAAREIVIRLADKRVLNANECCDGCVRSAIDSLQDIRRLLVDKQVELSDHHGGALYLILETMLQAIRAFLTFSEALDPRPAHLDEYRASLGALRGHLYRSLSQVAAIARMDIPTIPQHMRFDSPWPEHLYLYSRDAGADLE